MQGHSSILLGHLPVLLGTVFCHFNGKKQHSNGYTLRDILCNNIRQAAICATCLFAADFWNPQHLFQSRKNLFLYMPAAICSLVGHREALRGKYGGPE